jgi:cytochrome b
MPQDKLTIIVWDLPTRLFHWSLAGLVIAAAATAFLDLLEIHIWIGQAVLVLLLWRVLWGFVGSETARFSNFVRGWPAVRAYLLALFNKNSHNHNRHNPLGGWAVLLMLAMLFLQTGLGLFSSDDILVSAPLADRVSKETSHMLSEFHELNFFVFVLPILALHIAASIFYLVFKKQNLIKPMITGDITAAINTPQPRTAPLWLAGVCLGTAVVAAFVGTQLL